MIHQQPGSAQHKSSISALANAIASNMKLAADILNLFDRKDGDIDSPYATRRPEETAPVDDIRTLPAEPGTASDWP
ncbi:MAG TPA: hypothetical protein VEC06_16635 [Paucimonas sp.]|nr:hypothetical protein [Paucimonas sp.]